ncbi:unnamed protein product [Linum trigynum]|uniref:Pentatricopeptide repeat-containing protein n=1 Tax=Linum trigynum TaxID=586398 RepID=A0AAV2E372_9ROSI
MLMALQELREAGFVDETVQLREGMLPDERIKSIVSCEDKSDEDSDENEDEVIKLKPWLDPKALADALSKWSPEVVSTLEDAKFVWTTRLVCKILRNLKSPETAWDFFCWAAYQSGFTHDVYTVQRMITVLFRHGKVELVDQLIAKIRNEGMELPLSNIRLIIEFYGVSVKNQLIPNNSSCWEKIFREDRLLCGYIHEFNLMILYSALLRTLTNCKREMLSCGICPDSQTISALMYHFGLQGDVKTVCKLFMTVRQNGVAIDG